MIHDNMFKRPKPGEDEDDLLKFQQEFLASQKQHPSASVKKADKRKSDSNDDEKKDVVKLEGLPSTLPTEATIPVKKSKFRQAREDQTSKSSSNYDPEENIEKHDRHMAQVLSHIIERDTRNAAIFLPRKATQAFPSAMHRGAMTKETSETGKKKSVFAQHLAMSGAQDFGVVLQQEMQRAGEVVQAPYTDTACSGEGDPGSRSRLVQGSGLSATLGMDEARKIHEENVEKMCQMSEEEIMEERKKLLEMLDPKLVEFLAAKKKEASEKKESETSMETDSASDMRNVKKKKKEKKSTDPELAIQRDSGWVHMDKVEYDKLEWMKDLPPPKPADSKSGVAARFDFQGTLLAADADIPVYKGLHHHGVEPERAGYSLEEMFQLARSSNNQQRTLALQLLSRVINRAKSGAYVDLIQSPIVPSILESGVIFLFRWALDDSVDSVLFASVAALHALICNQGDQRCVDFTLSWYQGHVSAGQCPQSCEGETQDGEETVEETDAEVASRDIIQALVTRMVLLQRVRHILESRRPQSVTVIQLLEILTRIAQHSPSLAYEIVHFPGLLDKIFKDYLPTSWTPTEEVATPLSDVQGYPLTSALKLVGALCQAGRNMAAHLVSKYKLQDILLRYMAVKPSELQLAETEAEMLQTQSFTVWRICLSYGFTTHTFLDIYSPLVSYIQAVRQRYTGQVVAKEQLQLREAAMFACCETAVNVAGTARKQTGFRRSQDGSSMETERSEEVTSPVINWSHVAGLVQPITSCTQCMLQHIQENYQFKKHDLHVETSCINFLASFYKQLEQQASYNPVECLQDSEAFFDSVLLPFLKSVGFKSMLGNLSNHSNLLNSPESTSNEVAPSIVELKSSLPEQNYINPVCGGNSPIGFITALLRLVYVFCKLHKGLIDKMLVVVTQDENLTGYMKKVSQHNRSCLTDNYFTRFENYLQYYYLKLITLKPMGEMSVLHRGALHLLARLQDGDEHLVHDLLSTVVFNPHFIPDSKEEDIACDNMEELKLSETSPLKSASEGEVTVSRVELLKDVHSRLASIRSTYMTAFSTHQHAAAVSRHRLSPSPLDTESLMTRSSGQAVLPLDWMYLPLIELYTRASIPGSKLQECVPPHLVSMATDVLYWVYVLECWRTHILGAVSVTLKMSRVMCAFMAGNDLFLNKSVSRLLVALLREYTKPTNLDHMDFTETIPGLTSFYDLFEELLQQFESVSFGDSVFACYVLVALQRRHAVQMRRLVWGEKSTVLRVLRLPLSQVLIPLQRFLEPDESDLPLLQLYFQCLLSQSVRPTWSPLMYLTAVHHLNRFLYYHGNQEHQKVKDTMWRQLLNCKLEEVKGHIIYFKSADSEKEFGMEFYTNLPAIRQTVLDKFNSQR